jgi:hypothetical protein
MRWQALFDDLEAQLEAAEAAELAGEVAERTRIEHGRVRLGDRLAAAAGSPVGLAVPGHGVVRGRLQDAGADWVLLDDGDAGAGGRAAGRAGGREVLVPQAALLSVSGLPRTAAAPDAAGAVGRRLDLRWALRGLARSRAGVVVGLVDGSSLSGTLDRVGADHVDLAEHPAGEARRATAVRGVRLVPLAALAVVRSG